MNIKSIVRGIGKYTAALNKLSAETGVSRWYLYPDCAWSWLRYGCVLNHYAEGGFYRRKGFERRAITTYRRWKKIIEYNNPDYCHFLQNKLDFCGLFKDYIGREYLSSRKMTEEEFVAFLKRYGRVFIKPVNGWEGQGVEEVTLGDESHNEALYKKLSAGHFIIEEPVVQHPDMVFGNKSVNTIRVYTTFDKKLDKGVCIATTLRAGVGDSHVDNSHAGGVSYEVDLETGVIDSRGWGHKYNGGIFHPQTDICMLGRKIPCWTQVVELCQKAAALIPEVPYIGWDVAITANGPILIEGNHDPDIDILEFVGKYGYYYTIMSHLRN